MMTDVENIFSVLNTTYVWMHIMWLTIMAIIMLMTFIYSKRQLTQSKPLQKKEALNPTMFATSNTDLN